ncbi:AMP-binding protein, partial [Roseibium sp. RKSG952]|uniref:AMP-binding protein n=1 Tax=Roseibium sp. RKSG952 TaxID=2529384 RepID=UPI0012BCB996
MLEDARAGWVVTRQKLGELLPDPTNRVGCKTLILDGTYSSAVIARFAETPVVDAERAIPLTPLSLSYVIYTSGSTGKPKAVMIGHVNALNLARHQAQQVLQGRSQRVALFASIGFDASLSELLMSFLTGSCLIVAPEHVKGSGADTATFAATSRVTTITLPPVLLAEFLERNSGCLKTLVTAGEAPEPNSVAMASSRYRYLNGYGPTETTVSATEYLISAGWTAGRLPIGSPSMNTQVYVFDAYLIPVPFSVSGELLIGGVQVSRGY